MIFNSFVNLVAAEMLKFAAGYNAQTLQLTAFSFLFCRFKLQTIINQSIDKQLVICVSKIIDNALGNLVANLVGVFQLVERSLHQILD